MAKLYSRSVIVVSTFCEEGVSYDVPADVEYRVRALGRGRWYVEREDGFRRLLRTAELQRYFRPRRYEDGYWSSGEPQYFVSEVHVYKA